MKTIFEIQKIDGQILQLKKQIKESPANKRTKELIDFMHDGKAFIAKTNKYASTLINELNNLQTRYTNALSKADIMRAQHVESVTDEQLSAKVNEASGLSAEMAKLESRIKSLSDNINRLIQDYNNAMNKLRVAKEKIAQSKSEVTAVSNKITPQIQELEKKKKTIESSANKDLLEIYTRMRQDNLYPVFVHSTGNRCGGCHMELSLNFVDRLKSKKMLQCEECHRYILSDDE